jgi:SagB-type dehydrogenase family enzyme
MLPAEDPYSLALLYHVNSEPWLNLEAYDDPLNEMRFKRLPVSGRAQPLLEPHSDSLLQRLIRRRRSCRDFVQKEMPLASLSDILANSYGISEILVNPDGLKSYARPVPSGGALYPLEIYIAAQSIEGCGDGVYHYNIPTHCLEPMRHGPSVEELCNHLLNQYFVKAANTVLMFSAVFERTLRKYGPRGYRYVLLEAGHAAQNVCLLATELGLATLCIGGFQDHRLNAHLGLDGTNEAIIYLVAIGYGAEKAQNGEIPRR